MSFDEELFKQRQSQFEKLVGDKKSLLGKDLCLDVDGETLQSCFFNWFQLFLEQSKDEHAYAQDIEDNHVPEAILERYEKFELVPIIVLDLRSVHDLACMPESGTLFVDLTASSGNDAPILFYDLMGIDSEEDEPATFERSLQEVLMDLKPEE